MELSSARSESEALRCWHVRPMVLGDRAYVRATWIDSYRQTRTGLSRAMPDGLLLHGWGRLIKRTLDTATVLVACVDGDEDVIVGWACLDTGRRIVHYCYVREAWQRKGIATDLLGSKSRERYLYSHRTKALASETHQGAHVPDAWRHAPWLLVSEALEVR